MLLEGMLLPIPSEVVMAFGGYLVVTGALQAQLGIPAVILLLLSGTVGNVTGASIAYYIGKLGGLRFIERYGRYLLIDNKSVIRAQRFFDKYGSMSVFATRLLPIFRTFISIPAGIAQMDIKTFLVYTSLGTLSWNSILIYLGFTLGSKWQLLLPFFDFLTYVVALIIVAILIWWLCTTIKRKHLTASAK